MDVFSNLFVQFSMFVNFFSNEAYICVLSTEVVSYKYIFITHLEYPERGGLMKKNPNIYRKRMIPEECILLKDDILLEVTDDIIVTKWNTLKPKRELHHGFSCYFLKQGFKVSKFYRADNSLMYWYCDIVDYDYNEETNTLVSTDLLADVIIYPDGFVKVVDLDELALAVEKQICEPEKITLALKNLNNLLNLIYDDKFDVLMAYIEKWDR